MWYYSNQIKGKQGILIESRCTELQFAAFKRMSHLNWKGIRAGRARPILAFNILIAALSQ